MATSPLRPLVEPNHPPRGARAGCWPGPSPPCGTAAISYAFENGWYPDSSRSGSIHLRIATSRSRMGCASMRHERKETSMIHDDQEIIEFAIEWLPSGGGDEFIFLTSVLRRTLSTGECSPC